MPIGAAFFYFIFILVFVWFYYSLSYLCYYSPKNTNMLKPLTFYQFATLLFVFAKFQNQISGLSFWFVLVPIVLEMVHTFYLYYAKAKGWQTDPVIKLMSLVLSSYQSYKMNKLRKKFLNEEKKQTTA